MSKDWPGAKLDRENDNFYDSFQYDIIEKISPFIHKCNITPDQITLLSFLCGLLSVYFLKNKQYEYAAIFWLLNYFFDCMDGYIARKYQIFSKYGDYYDHISDWTTYLLLLYVMFKDKNYKAIIIMAFFTLTLMFFVDCQEKIYNKKHESPTLDSNPLSGICQNTENIKYAKWFSSGTFTLIIVLVILYYEKLK